MRNIKDFQARYDRWKNGERYWDIRDVDLPRYDTADKNTDQEYIFQRSNGTYYSSPTNSNAFTEDVTPVLKRDLSNPATWDFVGSDTNKKYTTQYTDDQLRQMAQDSMPNAEMIPWIDRAGNKQRSARVIGLSPADPVTSLAVEYAMGLPGWKALDYAGNKLAIDFARDFAFTKLGNWTRNKILSNQLNKNIKNWDGTVGTEYFNSPNYWYRWSETPEVEGIREMGKNVTTRDAINTINVPSNNWRMAAMENYSKSKNGYWYKAIKPDEDMSLRERAKWIRTSKDKPIGYGKKVTSSNGNRSQGSYGRPWNGSLSTSGIGQLGLLEGNIGTHIPYSKFDRSVFALTPIEEVPIGGRIGFKTGEMPMDNLGWFTKLPNGRFKYNGEVLPYKRIEMLKKQGNGRYQFDSPTYQMYTGPKHDISEIINADGSVNLRTLLNVQNEALQNVPGGTIARHRLENAKWHPTDWNTFLHTRDAYKRALDNNYPQEALFPTLMHDFGKMWAGDGHGPYGASIVRQIFPKASNEQIQAIYEHMNSNPQNYISKLVKGADIKEPNQFRTDGLYEYLLSHDKSKLPSFVQDYFKQKAQYGVLNVYHSTDHGPFTTFKPTKGHMGGLIEPFFHFGDVNTKKFFEKFPEYTTRRFNIKGSNFLNVDDFTHSTPSQLINELYKRGYITRDKLSSLRDKMYDKRYFDRPDLFAQDVLTELNSDGIHYINKVEGVGSDAYGITNPNYIKLANPIVYDDFGKIIPLSQRFDFTNSDIRYNYGKTAYEKEK